MTSPSTSTTSLPPDLVSPSEAARILRLSKWTIYQWLGRGYIPYYRMGRLIRIREADLLAKLEAERQSGAIPPDFTPGN